MNVNLSLGCIQSAATYYLVSSGDTERDSRYIWD